MIRIEDLNLELPENLRHRVGEIVRLTSQELAKNSAALSGHIETLDIGNMTIDTRDTNTAIARKIAKSITRAALANTGGQHA